MKNIKEIKDKLHTKEYLFLRTDPRLEDNIILLGLGGSHAYGTAIETSDLDIRGCALNTREEILLGRDFEQVTDSTTDTVIYSFKKLVTLLKNVNPNTIELLGLEPWQYLYVSGAGHELLANKKLFLSKKCINSFGGYANQQLYRLNQLSKHSMHQEELEKHILKTLEFMRESFTERYSPFPDDGIRLYLDDSEQEGRDKEIFMDVRLTHYPLRDYCSMWNELQNTVSQYGKLGKRDRYAAEHKKIAKHSMHLVRLYLMCFDILERGEIKTYREAEHDLLMDIRNGKYLDDNNQPIPEFFEMVNELEKRLEYDKTNTDLPDLPDYKRIDELVMHVNESIIKA